MNLVLFEPESKWTPPTKFPDVPCGSVVAIDLETKDPNIRNKGPGGIRGDGYVTGIAIAFGDYKAYYPIQHPEGNMNREAVIKYIYELGHRLDLQWVGCNLPYDVEWLNTLGITLDGRWHDIQLLDPLLDEELRSYSLDSIGKRHVGAGKDETQLIEAASCYGVNPKFEMYKLPAKHVGEYAEMDAVLTLKCFQAIYPKLDESLLRVYNMECQLMPIIWEMRRMGVRVDLDKADQLSLKLKIQEEDVRAQIKAKAGWAVDIWSSQAMEKAAKKLGLDYIRTEKGNPSFPKLFLQHSDEPFYKMIQKARNLHRLRNVFIEELIYGNHINGRIHCQFHQMKREDGGTRTGRFSSSNPNLQQIPSRDKELAPMIRSMFLPEEGDQWCKIDYSQQEPRLLTHYGALMKLPGAGTVQKAYYEDKRTDFYTVVAKAANLERKPAKDLTLGRCYGEGRDKIANDLGVSLDEADHITKMFDEANPFIKELGRMVMNRADKKGYISTIMGRRRHFNFWEPINYRFKKKGEVPLRKEQAEQTWPSCTLRRAYTYKALNALIQGSAADMTKMAMIKVAKELKYVPLMQVHDELNFSMNSVKECEQIRDIMEDAVDTCVPMLADLEIQETWK